MSCEHPNCSQSIHSICTNHCHWSLCQEHFHEHKNSLLVEFEEALEDLIPSTDELAKSVDKMKVISLANQEKELQGIQRTHRQAIDHLEQKSIELNKYQNQFNQLSEHFIQIKSNQKILTQDDFQQIENLSKEIHQYQNSFNNFNTQSSPPSSELNLCPINTLNIFGLSSFHDVPLCTPNRKLRNLSEHLRNYHHLMPQYAEQLIDAVRLQSDPMEIIIFPPNTQVTTMGKKYPCSFYDTTEVNGIHSNSCATKVTPKFLPIHLKTVHRLRSVQIKEVLQSK